MGNYNLTSGLNISRGSIIFYDAVGSAESSIVSSCVNKDQCIKVCRKGPLDPVVSVPDASTARYAQSEDRLVPAVAVLATLCALMLVIGTVLVVRRGDCTRVFSFLKKKKNSSE